MFTELPEYIMWGLAAVVALYIIVRVISNRLMVWDKAETSEDAHLFRTAIFGYKPVWVGYSLWVGIAFATLSVINADGYLGYLPVIFVIAYQLWKLTTPRDYRGVVGKIMCATLPFTLGFYCLAYPSANPAVFALLLAWIVASMGMQVLTLKAISTFDFRAQVQKAMVFERDNIFGSPGKGLKKSKLDAKNVELGMIGEQKTASVLNRLAHANSEFFVFHSVSWLSNSTYDIDHVVYYKGNILFLDSKFWGGGTHEVDSANRVYRNGQSRDMELHLPSALAEYCQQISRYNSPVNRSDVWVVVQGNVDADVVIGSHGSNDDLMLVAGYDLEAQLVNWMDIIESKSWTRHRDYATLGLFREHVK